MLRSFLLTACCQTAASATYCRSTPGTSSWPYHAEWRMLNSSLDGCLIKAIPPAAVCHPHNQAFDSFLCKAINWSNASTYADDPVGIINPNWSNDSCLPLFQYPCSGEGFPVFVVNASSPEHVAASVKFARNHNIRLNVKGSGHDYLGRSVAANSLSIWTKHLRGIRFHSSFKPTDCGSCLSHAAVTLGAGEDWGEIYAAANALNLTLVGGTGNTIGLGGYLTGGGHSPLSAMLGLAVDQLLEMQVVLASGDVVTANEMLNCDLFWAMRGGGGATFGVMTSVTLKTFPQMPVVALSMIIATPPASDMCWTSITYIVSQAPKLQDHGVMGYSYISPAYSYNGTTICGLLGTLLLPNGTVEELRNATQVLQDHISQLPGVHAQFIPTQYSSLYEWYQTNKNTLPIGKNNAVGNRLLDRKALSNTTALQAAIQKATPAGTLANLNLVAGPGLWAARPAGGGDAANPAWRRAYVEYAVPVQWPFRNETARQIETNLLTNVYLKALRELAPDTGSYLNEVKYTETGGGISAEYAS